MSSFVGLGSPVMGFSALMMANNPADDPMSLSLDFGIGFGSSSCDVLNAQHNSVANNNRHVSGSDSRVPHSPRDDSAWISGHIEASPHSASFYSDAFASGLDNGHKEVRILRFTSLSRSYKKKTLFTLD
jgi:hypothetical protein